LDECFLHFIINNKIIHQFENNCCDIGEKEEYSKWELAGGRTRKKRGVGLGTREGNPSEMWQILDYTNEQLV
jgi:hypothetical protein